MTIVIIAILCYRLASAFFLLCVMMTARGKEYGNQVTAPSKHSGALSSSATVEPSRRADDVDDLAAVLRRIDVNPKRPLAKWGVDDLDNRFRDQANVGVGGLERRDTFQD